MVRAAMITNVLLDILLHLHPPICVAATIAHLDLIDIAALAANPFTDVLDNISVILLKFVVEVLEIVVV